MKSQNSSSQKDITFNKINRRLPRINNSLHTLRSLSQINPSYETSQFINNLNEFSNSQNQQKCLKNDNAFNNFIFQDNFTKKKISYADLKSEANNRIAQSSNNIYQFDVNNNDLKLNLFMLLKARSVNSLIDGGNLHSFQINNVSQNSSIHHNPIQSNSKLNISAIHPRPSNHVIDFQKEVKNSIQQFSDYAVILKSSEQQVKNLVKLQLQKHESEVNSKNPNFNHKRLDYVETKKNIFKIERDSLHSLLNDDNFKFDPKLHKMNFVTLCQMSEEDRSQIEAYFKQSLSKQFLILSSIFRKQATLKNYYVKKDIKQLQMSNQYCTLKFQKNKLMEKQNIIQFCLFNKEKDPLIVQNQQVHDIKSNYHSYSELVPQEAESMNQQQKNLQGFEDSQSQIIDPPKKKLMVFNDTFDPFKKKVLKSFARKKKNFDIFQDPNTELTLANKLDLIKDNLKENVILKLKQQYGVKNSHLIVPSLNYLSFKDLDVDRNIMIYKYFQNMQGTKDNNNQNENPIKNQQIVKLPSIHLNTQRQTSSIESSKAPNNVGDQLELLQNKLDLQNEMDYIRERYYEQDERNINQLPEGKMLKPFYKMTQYKTQEQIVDSQKQQLENLKQRFSNKKMTEEQDLFCKRLEENDLIEIQFLLNRNPNLINTIDKDGDSILHLACRKCNLTVIKYLLQQGANVNALNTNMKTPYEVCKLIKREKLINFFDIYFEDKKNKQAVTVEMNNAASPSDISQQQKKKSSDTQDNIQQNTNESNSKIVHFSKETQDSQN